MKSSDTASAIMLAAAKNLRNVQDATEILQACRTCLHHWGARYAGSNHALKHKKETNLLIERIDEWLLRQ